MLGAGFICDAHAKALRARADVELAALCDQDRAKAARAGARYGIGQLYSSLDEMLAADLDAVHVLLPPERHVDAARRILESGRHALVEKPMGLDAAQCRELAELAEERGLRLAASHNFLFSPAFEKLRRDAADGTLGPLDQLTLHWMYPLGLRDPGNLFFEVGSHLIAFMLALVGPLERLQASASRPLDIAAARRVYRHWRVHGWKGRTAVDLVLSVDAGPAERSIAVRGHGALAKCYFDRDLYYRHEPVGDGVGDNFASATGVAWQLATNAARNLVKSVAGTLRKAPAASPFEESIARSVGRFYETLQGEPDARLTAQFGAAVVAECERVVQSAGFGPGDTGKSSFLSTAAPKRPSVLVVGGSGFIGRHLVRSLVAKGVAVRVATRNARSAELALAGLAVELAQGDPADPDFIDAALQDIAVVYHLAKGNDVLVTQNIARRALQKAVRRFVYTGTIDSYYAANAGEVITCDTPLDPKIHRRNAYARAKAACEALLMDLHRRHRFPVVIVRPGIVIGSGSPAAHWGVGKFLSDTRVQLWGDGRNPLPFVLVEDVAAALVLALDKPGIEGQSFLLTDEPLLSAREYTAALSAACGTRLRARPTPTWEFYLGDLVKEAAKHLIGHPNRKLPSYRDWDSRSQRARYDSSKTRQALGWQPAGTREALIRRGVVAAVLTTRAGFSR